MENIFDINDVVYYHNSYRIAKGIVGRIVIDERIVSYYLKHPGGQVNQTKIFNQNQLFESPKSLCDTLLDNYSE